MIRAETMLAFAVAEHNLPYSVADHFSDMVKKMFPANQIAAKFACKKTKCTQIVKKTWAPDFFIKVEDQCKNKPFSILVDESNNRGTQKCLAVMVRIFDGESVITRFLDMPIANNTNADTLFDALNECLISRGLSYSNVMGYMSDKCNLMKGKKLCLPVSKLNSPMLWTLLEIFVHVTKM